MTRTLLEISADLTAIESVLYDAGGELPDDPDTEAALDEWFATLGAERDQKLDNYAALIREIEARAEIRKMEAARLSQRASTDKNIVALLKARLQYFFVAHGLKTIETPRFRLTLAQNGGKLPMTLLVEPEQLPEEFQIVETIIKPDTEAIRGCLESGQRLEFARLCERGTNLRIK